MLSRAAKTADNSFHCCAAPAAAARPRPPPGWPAGVSGAHAHPRGRRRLHKVALPAAAGFRHQGAANGQSAVCVALRRCQAS